MADQNLTTLHVRQAVAGDLDSQSWIIERFTPLLLAQARYRSGVETLITLLDRRPTRATSLVEAVLRFEEHIQPTLRAVSGE